MPKSSNPITSIEDLESRVTVNSNGCWVFGEGKWYPQANVRGVPQPLHSAAWELANGPMPAGHIACHKCNNPRCVRPHPDHVYAGTPLQNVADREARYKTGEISRTRHQMKQRFFHQWRASMEAV